MGRLVEGLDLAMCLGSSEEVGRYLEVLKAFEHKSADLIRERTSAIYLDRVTEVLTSIKPVNKTDALTLITNYGVRMSC